MFHCGSAGFPSISLNGMALQAAGPAFFGSLCSFQGHLRFHLNCPPFSPVLSPCKRTWIDGRIRCAFASGSSWSSALELQWRLASFCHVSGRGSSLVAPTRFRSTVVCLPVFTQAHRKIHLFPIAVSEAQQGHRPHIVHRRIGSVFRAFHFHGNGNAWRESYAEPPQPWLVRRSCQTPLA